MVTGLWSAAHDRASSVPVSCRLEAVADSLVTTIASALVSAAANALVSTAASALVPTTAAAALICAATLVAR